MSEKGERPERKPSNVTADFPAIPRVIKEMRRTRGSRFPAVQNESKETKDPALNPELPVEEKTEE